jgi:hypothetical protein
MTGESFFKSRDVAFLSSCAYRSLRVSWISFKLIFLTSLKIRALDYFVSLFNLSSISAILSVSYFIIGFSFGAFVIRAGLFLSSGGPVYDETGTPPSPGFTPRISRLNVQRNFLLVNFVCNIVKYISKFVKIRQ